MRISSIDTETGLIKPGLPQPPIVCVQIAEQRLEPRVIPWHFGGDVAARLHLETIGAESRPDAHSTCGSNIAYDMAGFCEWSPELKPLIFELYDRGNILSTSIHERLRQISAGELEGKIGLEAMAGRYGYKLSAKSKETATTYWQYFGRPFSDYSAEHATYALEDAAAGRHIGQAQFDSGKVPLVVWQAHSRYEMALHVTAARGLHIDPSRKADFEAAARTHESQLRAMAIGAGFVRPDGTKDTASIKEAVAAAFGPNYPLTAGGGVSTNAEALAASGNPTLEALAEWGHWQKVVGDCAGMLSANVINTRYGLADTTRSTSKQPPVQNWPKSGGMRECVVARPGYALLSADVKGLESATHAQVLANDGMHMLASKINAGVDPLIEFAAHFYSVDYEQLKRSVDSGDPRAKEMRQHAKAPVYGLPGVMGAATLLKQLRKSGVDCDLEFAEKMVLKWRDLYPQTVVAHKAIKRSYDRGFFSYDVPGAPAKFTRRGCTYAAACNGRLLQSLGAQMMLSVLWDVVKAQQVGDMNGSFANAFIHDEILIEAPLDALDEHAEKLEALFNAGFKRFCPDVNMSTEVVASNVWSKRARRIVSNGKLTVWEG
jgi:hypothetical protein